MLFNSIDFAVFLPIVFLLYWFVFNEKLKFQNLLLVTASYLFYGWWDWKFLTLIFFSTIVDYTISLKIIGERNQIRRKIYLYISLLTNLGLLFYFKYYNFFVENFITAFSFFGLELDTYSLNIILPVGISFYTFQTLSYTIDVYRNKILPTKDFIAFSAFVSFFPQLVAGPIERAINLLPQFNKPRAFNYPDAVCGLRQILWGFFKKVVIADNCAEYANLIFNNSADYNGSTLLIGALFFTFQIYGDFSGYSDIAIGTARLFGFRLMQNFNFPYFSRDIAEFWRRWHISLSTWFRDYLYIPLGGSRNGTAQSIRNIFIIFIISGLWHGANWTYIAWGTLNAIYFLPLFLAKKNRKNTKDFTPDHKLRLSELTSILVTFSLTVCAWIFFRAENMNHAYHIIGEVLSPSLFEFPNFKGKAGAFSIICLTGIFLVIEWKGKDGEFALHHFGLLWHKNLRLLFYLIITVAVFLCSGSKQEFIYFQF